MSKTLFAAIMALMTLVACNTLRGAGQDVSAAGHAVSDQAAETQKQM